MRAAAKKYAEAVKAQAKAQKALDASNDAWAAAIEPSARLRCRLATEAAERELQAKIGEVTAAHAAYWAGRASELRPALEELALVAFRFDTMMRASGCMVVEPWSQVVRGVLGSPLPPDAMGTLVGDVPLRPELSDEFDCSEAKIVDRERIAKAERELVRSRKWL